MRLVRVVFLWVSQKLVGVALARLPHIAKRQAVARQCQDGNGGLECSGSPDVVEGIVALGLAAVLLAWTALVRRSVPEVRSRGVSQPASCQVQESVLQSIEELRFMFTLESVRQSLQDHVHSIVSGHILWFQSVASIPSWACQRAQNTRPLQLSWCAREQKPQFHLLTITLELARLGTSETQVVGHCSAYWVLILAFHHSLL